MFKLSEVMAQYVSEFSVKREAFGNLVLLSNPTLEYLPGLLQLVAVVKRRCRFLPTTLDLTDDAIYEFFSDVEDIAESDDVRDEMVAHVLWFLLWAKSNGYVSEASGDVLIHTVRSLPFTLPQGPK